MPKKNIRIALSTLTLLGAVSGQADEVLDFQSLGTGEEIREEILPVAAEEGSTDQTPKAKKKKKEEEKKKKPTEGKCGEGKCNS